MMPSAPPPQPKRWSFPAWGVIPIGFVLVVVAFLAIWQFLAPSERHVIVPYSDFMTDVHDGNVDEIQIHDRDIRYRARRGDHVVFFETVGPKPDQGMLDSLKPTDPNKPAPKISLVK